MFNIKAKRIKEQGHIIAILEDRIRIYKNELADVREQRDEAKDLKSILTKLADKVETTVSKEYLDGLVANGSHIPEDVARYVEDLFGGQVIKQEANRAIKISKAGLVEVGVTGKVCDKGRTYKLVQE